MAYKVLIVDDEPPFLRSLRRSLQMHPDFEVVSEAFNGLEALQKAKEYNPDVVFTDIKMPGIDGIELIKRIEPYGTLCVIISGHQDFNYAREAMKTNALEYLLKPIDPEQLNGVMCNLKKRLNAHYNAMERETLQALVFTGVHLQAPPSLAALHWTVSLLRLFGSASSLEAAKEQMVSASDCYGNVQRAFWLEGSNTRSMIALIGREADNACTADASAFTVRCLDIAAQNDMHLVIATCDNAVPLHGIYHRAALLREAQAMGDCIGAPRHIRLGDSPASFDAPLLDTFLQNQLRYLILNRFYHEIDRELERMFARFQKQGYPRWGIRQALHQILLMAQEAGASGQYSTVIDRELEEALDCALNYDSLREVVIQLLERFLDGTSPGPKPLAEVMAEYTNANISSPISLQTLCNAFSLSQPTVSRIFREHFNLSFGEYLAKMRMEHALAIMQDHPEMLLKDVAKIVGYEDPHYFSRRFKQMMGKSPSSLKL